MKFINNRNAPDIPDEILVAQESGQLALFCGAGISRAAGLPNFEELVGDVYKELSTEPEHLEKTALKQRLFDRALNLLESRIDRFQVRQALMKKISLDSDADLSVYKPLLTLSRTQEGQYRLVTTNVDRGLVMADPGIESHLERYPKLPPVTPHMDSVVFLHGIIDESLDPEGENLIFTSGDFGKAYLLHDPRASRFVTDLFRHFTVLFVGYSLDDPIVRYLSDAIAAERQTFPHSFKQPYVLVREKREGIQDTTDPWEAQGIRPILYSGEYSLLHDTLKAWADYAQDDMAEKENYIAKYAYIRPRAPDDNHVVKLIQILKDKTGNCARFFKDLNPPAPIEWLPVLEQNGLLSITAPPNTLTPFTDKSQRSNIQVPGKISQNLWEWLAHHLDEKQLVERVIDGGCRLHPYLKESIQYKISGSSKPEEPYLTFWRIVTSGYAFSDSAVDTLKNIDTLSLHHFSCLIRPKFKITKEKVKLQKPYDIEVVTSFSECLYRELKKTEGYPEKFAPLLLTCTAYLQTGLEFFKFIGKDSQSYWHLPSIAPHSQNRYHPWTVLIELCRDLWDGAWRSNPQQALAVLQVWKTIKHYDFRRLVFYAYSKESVISADDALDCLLEDNGKWLLAYETKKEKFRLLARISSQLSEMAMRKLEATIDHFQQINASTDVRRETCYLLRKIKSFGGLLTDGLKERLAQLSQEFPRLTASKHEEIGEFCIWSQTISEYRSDGYRSDFTKDDLFLLHPSDLIEKLTDKTLIAYKAHRFLDGRLYSFQAMCQEYPEKGVETLIYLNNQKIWDIKEFDVQMCHINVWYGGLLGLSESKNPPWLPIARLFQDADHELFSIPKGVWSIANWMRKSAPNIQPDSEDEDLFWKIANNLLDAPGDDSQLNMPEMGMFLDADESILDRAVAGIDRIRSLLDTAGCNSQVGVKEDIFDRCIELIDRIRNLSDIADGDNRLGKDIFYREVACIDHLINKSLLNISKSNGQLNINKPINNQIRIFMESIIDSANKSLLGSNSGDSQPAMNEDMFDKVTP